MHLLNIYRWYRQNSALAIARHTGTSTSTSTEHDDRERERNKSAIPIKITQNTSITTIQSVLRARAPARIQQRNILHSNNKFNCKVSSSFSSSIFRHLCTRKLLCIHQAAREEVVDMRKERCIAWFLCVAHLIQIDCSLLALQTQLVRCKASNIEMPGPKRHRQRATKWFTKNPIDACGWGWLLVKRVNVKEIRMQWWERGRKRWTHREYAYLLKVKYCSFAMMSTWKMSKYMQIGTFDMDSMCGKVENPPLYQLVGWE